MRIQKTFLPVIRSPWWLVLWDVKFHWRSVCGYKFFFSKSRLLLTMAWFAKICPKNIMALLVLKLGPFKFLPAYRCYIIRFCNGNIGLLHFFQPMISQIWFFLLFCSVVLWVVERSVEGWHFHWISKQQCSGNLEET